MSSTITLYFCYDTSAHDCISQGKKPPKVTGVKRDRTVAKVLRAFCRSSELDDSVEKLQLGRCYCRSDKSDTQRSTAIFGPQDVILKTGLEDGDCIFVRRIQNQVQDQQMAESGEEIEEDDEEYQDEDEAEDGSRGLKDSPKRFKTSGNGVRLPTKETNSKCKVIQSRLNQVLGGKTWSSTPFFEYHLKLSSGVTYFEVLRACVLTALKLTTDPSNDGRLPLLLRQKIIPITRERIKSKNPKQSQKWISTSDLQNAHRMMKEEANQLELAGSGPSGVLTRHSAGKTRQSEDREQTQDSFYFSRNTVGTNDSFTTSSTSAISPPPASLSETVSLLEGLRNGMRSKLSQSSYSSSERVEALKHYQNFEDLLSDKQSR